MRHLEEASVKREIPPECDTHVHPAKARETSLPTSCSPFSGLSKDTASPLLESSHIIPTQSANKPAVPLPSSTEPWRYTARCEANTELQRSFSRPRASTHELDLDRSLSPPLSVADSSFDHDSDEDGETMPSTQRNGIRIGSQYQADDDDLYGAEIGEDNATLLWDPDMMSEDDLDLLMAQCNVSDSTLASRSSSSSPSLLHVVSTIPMQSSSESETFTASTSSSISSAEATTTRAKILPLEHWLQLVHDSHYDCSEVVSQQRRRGFFGWSARQSMFAVWTDEEKSLFELAMASFPKDFDQIARLVKTRSVGECAEFYYGWKHTDRYRAWRGQVVEPELDLEPQPEFHSRMLPNGHAPHYNYNNNSSSSKKRKREPEALLDSSERLYLEALGSFENPELMLNIILDAPSTLAEEVAATEQVHAEPEEEMTESTQHVTTAVNMALTRSVSSASPKRAKMAELDDHQLLHAISSDLLLSSQTIPATINPSSLSDLFLPPEPTMDFFMHF